MTRVYTSERIDAHRRKVVLRVYEKDSTLYSIEGFFAFSDLVDLHVLIHNSYYGSCLSHDIAQYLTRSRLIIDKSIKPEDACSYDLPF